VALALGPLVGVVAAIGEVGDGAPLCAEVGGAEPRGRVGALDEPRVVYVAVVRYGPLEHPQLGSARVGEAAAAGDRGQGERAGPQPAERRVGAGAGGRDHDQLRAGALQGGRAERQVDLVVAVGVELVDDRQRRTEAVQPRRVGGQHPHEAAEHLRLARLLAPAQLEMAVDEVRVVERAGEAGRGLEQDAGLAGCSPRRRSPI